MGMKSIYTISIFVGLVATTLFGTPVQAVSFQPTSQTYYVPAGSPVRIENNNINTNINTNTPAPQPTTYAAVPAPQPIPAKTTSVCTSCSTSGYHLTQTSSCGAAVAYADANMLKPTCSLVPTLAAEGAVQLTWRTQGATVAYMDNGIGHVALGGGSRIVTPTENVTYTLTVLNDNGIAGACAARVTVVSSGTTTAATTTSTTTATSTTSTSTDTATSTTSFFSTLFTADNLKMAAIPIIIVFGILIALLMLVMSRVKAAH